MRILTCILLLLASLRLHAQSSYNFSRIYLDKGLSNSRVNAITQDKFGYMWFGTFDGLNRYDGYTIKTFFTSGKADQLPSNRIEALYSDSKGRLWIGTNKGFVQFDFYTETFMLPDTTGAVGALIKQSNVSCFKEDAGKNLYAATNMGVFVLKANSNKWESLGNLIGTDRKLTQVVDILFYPKNTMWATTEHEGFYKIDLRNKHTQLLDYKTEFGDSCCYTMQKMAMLNNHEMMIGLYSYGITILDINTNQFRTVPGFLGKSDSIRFNSVFEVLSDNKKRIWLGSVYFGMVRYLHDKNAVQQLSANAFNPFSYSGKAVLSLFQDKQQNIWIGTARNGVYRFNPDIQSVVYDPLNTYTSNQNSSNDALCFAVQDSSSAWIGTSSGPFLYNFKKSQHQDLRSTSSFFKSLPEDRVNSCLKDRDGIVWFATSGAGLIRYDPAQQKFRRFQGNLSNQQSLVDDNISKIVELPTHEIVVLGSRRLSRFNTQTFKVSNYRYDSTHALSKLSNISDIYVDANNRLWVSTYRSKLYEYDPFTQKVVEHTAVANPELTGGIIYTIACDGDKVICGTINGLMVYNKSTKQIKSYLQQPQNRNITGLLPAGNSVWFNNEHTLGKLDLRTGSYVEVKNEVHESFLPLSDRSLIYAANGNILCGTAKGFIQIDPRTYSQSPNVFQPFITSFKVGNDELHGGIALQKIDLDYDQNFFSFSISAFNYLDADNIEYAYMLEGFDKQWQVLGKQRTGTYTNIPGGTYTLKLRAVSTTGNVVENTQQIHIHIDKAFWETWWFRIAMLLLAITIITVIYRYRVGVINKEARIRTDYEIKLNELENSALRTQMNPHFIFNCLNTINSFINSNDKTQANQYISKFSRLMRLILDHSRQKKILLSDEIEVLQLYIQIERIRFENKFDYDIEVDENIDPSDVEIAPLIIQPFVENSILHGLLPLPANGFLKIKMEKAGDTLLCTVEDNGVGRGARRSHGSDPNKRKSHGIDITLKRIEMFNKEHKLDANVEVIDLLTDDGLPAGTKVIIPVAWSQSF